VTTNPSNDQAPPRSRPLRIWRYLLVMFPPHFMLLSGIAKFYAVYFSLQALATEESIHITLPSMAGALSIVLFSLLMRIYDELKDAEADIRLGRAGDPRYMNRPIVTGAITINDLVILRWINTAVLIVINLPLGEWPLVGFAVLFLVTWLSFKWFFCPVISEHLLLAFLTHNPISLIFGGYIVAVYAGDYGADKMKRITRPTAGSLAGNWLLSCRSPSLFWARRARFFCRSRWDSAGSSRRLSRQQAWSRCTVVSRFGSRQARQQQTYSPL